MQQGLLPLFPLQVVLLPGGHLPLHIFEERYKEMIEEVLRDSLEFGVVLASEKGIVNTGCSATIDRVIKDYDDGRRDILCLGQRRFEILLVNDERNFLRGAVEFFDDDPAEPAPAELRLRAIEGYNALPALPATDRLDPASATEPQLSFKIAQAVEDLAFRQTLLATRNETDRMQQIIDFLPAFTMRQQRIHRLKQVAPTNGHGHRDVKER